MAKIHKLSPALADMIAAGEVVERPASVIKELVENSIDAGATSITVEIQNGGITFMRVTDNGCGISREDAPTAFLRHATSKISCADDLSCIETMGFRGEALAAISAVSKVDLMTRAEGESLGTAIRVEAGNVLEVDSAGCPQGTTMVVRELFYNTPARMKFLKRDSVEGSYISGAVQRQALGHPEIAFRFIRDGKQEFSTPGDGKLSSAIYSVMGRSCAREMVEIPVRSGAVRVSGYVGKPTASRGSRSYQHFFVNGRYVKSRMMMSALEEAYRNQLMVGRFPICVLQVEVPPETVDVNVHPAKTEVKFLRESDVFDAIHYGVLGALSHADAKPEIQLPQQKQTNPVPAPKPEVAAPVKTAGTPQPERPKTTAVGGKASGTIPEKKQDFYQRMTAEEFRGYQQLVAGAGEITPSNAAKEQLRQAEKKAQNVPEAQKASAPAAPTTPSRKRTVLHDSVCITPRPQSDTESKAADNTRREITEEGTFVVHSTKKKPDMDQLGLAMPAVKEIPQMPDPIPAAKPVSKPEAPAAEKVSMEEQEPESYRIIGEALKTYIIVEQGDALFLIDKHAAHERILFEKLKAQKREIIPQLLLMPLQADFSQEESAALLENTKLLGELGFELEDYGGGTTLIRTIPSDIDQSEAIPCLQELASKLLDGARPDSSAVFDEMLHTVACKAAIKGGWDTSPTELAALVAEVMTRDDIKYCPHGRPVCVRLSKNNLEKQFKRT